MMKRLMLLVVGIAIFMFSIQPIAAENRVNIYFFWGEGCPHCETQKTYLEKWKKKDANVNIYMYETWKNRENAALFFDVADAHGITPGGVPATFIGTRNWIGFSTNMANDMENYIEHCLDVGCDDKSYSIIFGDAGDNDVLPPKEDNNNFKEEVIEIFGYTISLGNMPLAFSTFLIAFIDGLNPCSLWVLAFLLGIVALTRDRKKIIIIGLTYLGVAGIAYGAFILGMINVFSYVAHLRWVMIFVALIATLFGLVNVKDFFWYKKGISLTISDNYKPKLYERVRNLMRPDSNTKTLMIGSAIMALGITLIELPCTAGLPMLWSKIVSVQNVGSGFFIFLFIVYLLTYFLVELIIFLTVVFTLKISKFEEKHGRFLKLVGGLIMLALAIILFFDLDILNDIGGTIILFGGIIISSIIIAKIYNKYIGLKEDKNEQ